VRKVLRSIGIEGRSFRTDSDEIRVPVRPEEVRVTATLEAVDLLLEGTLALAEVEDAGIAIDVDYLDRTIVEVGDQIRSLQEELRRDPTYGVWRKAFGAKTNLGSREQLGVVLYERLGYPCPFRTAPTDRYPDGKPSTDEAALASVDLPFVKTLLAVERLKKLKSTYLEGVRREVVDGFLHPTENLNTVRTFRSSSDSPNLHNIPIRDSKIGPLIRKAFVPRPGRLLVEADFGAMEFKIAACVWKDPEMVAYASDPSKDIHRDSAAELFLCEPSQVSKQMRYLAKNQFVFPTLYGSYYLQMARNIWEAIPGVKMKDDETLVARWLRRQGIRSPGDFDPKRDPRPGSYEAHVKAVEANFYRRFPVFAAGKEQRFADYEREGRSSLVTGFEVVWGKGGLCSRNNLLNDPVQGPAFHCLLWSLIRIQKILRKRRLKSLIVGQIHDCLLLDVPPEELQEVLDLIERVMTSDIRKAWDWLIVPLLVEIDVVGLGKTWADKSPWVRGEDGLWGPKAA
jgi:DNA polymerase-1